MKNLFALTLTLLLGYQAQAAVTASEFTADFIDQANHRLKITNRERAASGKRLYCTSLSKENEQAIKDLIKENPEITVAEFTDKLANTLKCYPEFWAPWGRKGLGGMALNTKAYVMDTLLIRDVLQDLNDRATVGDNEKVLDTYSRL
ncbi:MAG: hypothetical protein J7501_15105 [Bdellovibrio sp.]|nr:hypothetical protein [Bdellovibrio sp.]